MTARTKIISALTVLGLTAVATPAAAQFYSSPYGNGQGSHAQGHGGGDAAVQRCAAAVEQRLNGNYGGNQGYAGYGGGRVLNVTHTDRHGSRVRVRGYASSGQNQGYGEYGYGQQVADIKFKCDVDHHGRIQDLDLNRSRGHGH